MALSLSRQTRFTLNLDPTPAPEGYRAHFSRFRGGAGFVWSGPKTLSPAD